MDVRRWETEMTPLHITLSDIKNAAGKRILRISKNLDLSSSLTAPVIWEQSLWKKWWLEKPGWSSVHGASNLTHSDKGHPLGLVLAFLRWGRATIWGRTKIVEESDDSRIAATRTLVCHLHSTSSYSYILAPCSWISWSWISWCW